MKILQRESTHSPCDTVNYRTLTQPLQDGGLVLCTGIHALDPSLGIGWQEILSWCSMEGASCMELVIGQGVSQ